MTTAWVVHESVPGTTREVAEAIARALSSRVDVELHDFSRARSLPSGVGLLVLGAPTDAFGLIRPTTRDRDEQRAQQAVAAATTGVRGWLDLLGPRVPPIAFATFDTRVRHPGTPGSAAKKTAKVLRGLGYTEIAAPASFWVDGTMGPLLDGELGRARAWAQDLARVVAGPGPTDTPTPRAPGRRLGPSPSPGG